MAVIGETKFIKFTVAILTDMRMTLAQLSLGVMSLQENVNAIYEYMRVNIWPSQKINNMLPSRHCLRNLRHLHDWFRHLNNAGR